MRPAGAGGLLGPPTIPCKMLLDLAVAIALGGDCLTDLVVVRTQPGRVRTRHLVHNGVPVDRAARYCCPAHAGWAARGAGGRARQRVWQPHPRVADDGHVVIISASRSCWRTLRNRRHPTWRRIVGFGRHAHVPDHQRPGDAAQAGMACGDGTDG